MSQHRTDRRRGAAVTSSTKGSDAPRMGAPCLPVPDRKGSDEG